MAESTISDIFRKFDMLLNRELTYNEFKSFYECIFQNITENEFRNNILKRFTSSERGLSLRGFQEFFLDTIRTQGEETVWQYFENLGYNRDLYSIRSRCFILTLHSILELAVTVRDAIQTNLDNKTNILLIEKFGTMLENKAGVRCYYLQSPSTHSYSYAIYNDSDFPIEVNLDCSASE